MMVLTISLSAVIAVGVMMGLPHPLFHVGAYMHNASAARCNQAIPESVAHHTGGLER